MPKINTDAIMSCPHCGSKYHQKMPRIGTHINSKCVICHTIFKIININDCCVYCSYSNVVCPKMQKN